MDYVIKVCVKIARVFLMRQSFKISKVVCCLHGPFKGIRWVDHSQNFTTNCCVFTNPSGSTKKSCQANIVTCAVVHAEHVSRPSHVALVFPIAMW